MLLSRLARVWGLVTLRHTFVEWRHGFPGARGFPELRRPGPWVVASSSRRAPCGRGSGPGTATPFETWNETVKGNAPADKTRTENSEPSAPVGVNCTPLAADIDHKQKDPAGAGSQVVPRLQSYVPDARPSREEGCGPGVRSLTLLWQISGVTGDFGFPKSGLQ